MLRSGVPILQALDIVGDTTGNIVIRNAAADVRDSVRSGESLAGPLAEAPGLPADGGPDDGGRRGHRRLDTMLHKIAEFYDQEVEATTEALTALIEPLMIAVLGGIIGSMIIALYMPIFKVFDLIK